MALDRSLSRVRQGRDAPLLTATVFDPVSARLAKKVGFLCGVLPGSLASHTILGAPDDVSITLTELADLTRRICHASDLPIIVDADHGYGGIRNVARTVRELETAGAAAISIEDTDLPTPFGTLGQTFISVAEAEAKVATALETRRSDDFLIFARANLRGGRKLEDVGPLLDAYDQLKSDALFLVGVTTEDEVKKSLNSWEGPFIFSGLPPSIRNSTVVQDPRILALYQPHLPYAATISALRAALITQAEGEDPSVSPETTALLKSLLR